MSFIKKAAIDYAEKKTGRKYPNAQQLAWPAQCQLQDANALEPIMTTFAAGAAWALQESAKLADENAVNWDWSNGYPQQACKEIAERIRALENSPNGDVT